MPFSRFLLLLLCCGLFSQCRDEFSLEGDFVDVPTAYGFLDADDERHFVRVQRAFLESGGNALDIAQVADSIFYGEGEATVILTNLTTSDSVELARVDAEQFGLERDPGVFADNPNVVYTASDDELTLRGGDRINLRIARPGQPDASATTVLLDPFIVRGFNTGLIRLDDYNRDIPISWDRPDNAGIYDVRIFFNIRELFPDDPSRTRDVRLEWPVATGYVPMGDNISTQSVRLLVNSEEFYRFLGRELDPIDGVRRRFIDFDIVVTAGGEEIVDRRTLANANIGLTSAQALPRYTNLDGGIGLITSITSAANEAIDFDSNSRDSLSNGIYTRDLGF